MPTSPPSASSPTAPLEFASVFARLSPHVKALDACLREQIQAFEPEVREMADYCIDTSGKRIRPALVFLSGWQDDAVSPALVKVAAVIELVHLATLVHDDIMDEAGLRRGRDTAVKSFGPEAAVLLGDALFAHALHLAAQFPTTAVCSAVGESTRRVCAGEIIQTMRRGTTAITREDYYRVIDLKTAELFRVSCHLGSQLGGYDDDFVAAATIYGRQLGIAYQIFDDLADFFGEEGKIGKTLGTDLVSGKLTLPLLELADALKPTERAALMSEITGQAATNMELRLRQLRELDIFDRVNEALESQLRKGERAIGAFAALPAVPRLLSLAEVLRAQVKLLQP
ncbi:polyprenyl synthetase family protein [Synoicihabitans lomoniglobus]|uniref:Polyprenyl synthetase family protein n=1 Tax=Synoicihabitans lomoniglobus TaxID=2909285 RepID=A0AAF0CP23_9BACT|nr:polyprenyl synthetase family protein [Opitutaceae bacterium LMO-M01]WED65466.1 polyprenyl synthetase family protein [Opitutaceae bacterium LMO-M01]